MSCKNVYPRVSFTVLILVVIVSQIMSHFIYSHLLLIQYARQKTIYVHGPSIPPICFGNQLPNYFLLMVIENTLIVYGTKKRL